VLPKYLEVAVCSCAVAIDITEDCSSSVMPAFGQCLFITVNRFGPMFISFIGTTDIWSTHISDDAVSPKSLTMINMLFTLQTELQYLDLVSV